MPTFLLRAKPLVRAFFCVLYLAIISAYTSHAYADVSDMRAELESTSERIIRAMTEYGELSGDVPSAEQIKKLRNYIANVRDDQVAKTLDDVVNGLASLEKDIARLKTSPPVTENSKDGGGGAENLRSQFYDVYAQCSRTFERHENRSVIFVNSPCSKYEDRVKNRVWNAGNEQEKIEAYQEAIPALREISTQMAAIDTAELGRIHEEVKSFNARDAKLVVLAEERQSIEQRMNPLAEKMKEYESKAESYIDDASLNCRAEGVDFDCGNRCERSVRDPIFGTYRNEPDRRCLESCNFQEQRAIDDLNEQIEECIDERDWAKDKLEDIEYDYKSVQSRVLALYDQYERINDEIVSLADSNKSAVEELDQFLVKLHPEVFHAMNSEFSTYGVRSVSYRSD